MVASQLFVCRGAPEQCSAVREGRISNGAAGSTGPGTRSRCALSVQMRKCETRLRLYEQHVPGLIRDSYQLLSLSESDNVRYCRSAQHKHCPVLCSAALSSPALFPVSVKSNSVRHVTAGFEPDRPPQWKQGPISDVNRRATCYRVRLLSTDTLTPHIRARKRTSAHFPCNIHY